MAQAIEHASPRHEFEMWQLATHLTGPGAEGETLGRYTHVAVRLSWCDLCWDESAGNVWWIPNRDLEQRQWVKTFNMLAASSLLGLP